jgi:hypothetical protein
VDIKILYVLKLRQVCTFFLHPASPPGRRQSAKILPKTPPSGLMLRFGLGKSGFSAQVVAYAWFVKDF